MTKSANSSVTNATASTAEGSTPLMVSVIQLICIPVWSILLFFGLFGNVLTVVVLRSKWLRQSSTSFYLTALAITDMLYLLSSLGASIANFFFFPSEIRHLSHTLCVLNPFLNYTLAYISVWLLVAVTVERAIWVVLPFRAAHICTKKTAKIVVALLILGFCLMDSHFFVTLQFTDIVPGSKGCKPTYFINKVFPFLDLLLISVLPCSIMLVANCLIGWKLRVMRQFRAAVASTSKPRNSQEQEATDKSINLTRMLVSTNVFFIVSVTPLLIYDVIFFTVDVRAWAEQEEEVRGVLLLGIERLVYTPWYTNFAIHFLLYCLSGPTFRAEAIVLFRRLRTRLCPGKQRSKPIKEKAELKATMAADNPATPVPRDGHGRVELL